MKHLDDFPKYDENRRIQELSESAFYSAITECGVFFIQKEDKKDYGTDFQIEVRDDRAATNIRVHVQLKGTNCKENSDGSISRRDVYRSTLNYLTVPPDSIFVCYHIPSNRLLVRQVDSVIREYEHGNKHWDIQKTITVKFTENFDTVYQNTLKEHAVAYAKAQRDHRLSSTIQPPEEIPAWLKEERPVSVPVDQQQAKKLLIAFYNSGEDKSISQSFEIFRAVLGAAPKDLIHAYMAEINLGINGVACDKSRIEEGIKVLESAVNKGKYDPGSLLYSIGNGWLAVRNYEKAKEAYISALKSLEHGDPSVVAQCNKNLGTTMKNLGKEDEAYTLYEKALKYNPNLGEAHFALAVWHCKRNSELDRALDHLDAIVWHKSSAGTAASIQGWRAYIFFKTGDIRAAFREINTLLGKGDKFDWVWPWCERLVGVHGRTSLDAAQKALQFWDEHLSKFPKNLKAKTEKLLVIWYIKSNGGSVEHDFTSFKQAIANVVSQGAPEPAFLWDRTGHWAQDEENWVEAEKCYRKAFELSPSEYGYCLGTVLNFLGRYEEALPILTEQAEEHIPDEMSWFQVAVAREGMNDVEGCISAYKRAIQLDENYDLAWFNLGGIYWNSQNWELAIATWEGAIQRFPSHELSSKLLKDLPSLLKQ